MKIFLFICLFISSSFAFAQNKELNYSKTLTISDGLGHNGVTSICEDSRGYMWFGTYDGLNRYDGYEFKVFKNTPSNKIFVSNRIRSVVEDTKGNLWLGTDEGISVYKYSSETFETLFSNRSQTNNEAGPVVRDLKINDSNNRIVCTTEKDGILFFNADYTFDRQVFPSGKMEKKNVLFYSAAVLDSNHYLFTSDLGLLVYDYAKNEFEILIEGRIHQYNDILKLDGKQWLITLHNAIVFLSFSDEGSMNIKTVPTTYRFRKAALDDNGKIWFSCQDMGIVKVDKQSLVDKREVVVEALYSEVDGLLRPSCIHISQNSGCWLGSFDRGVLRFNLDDNPFFAPKSQKSADKKKYRQRISHISSLSKDEILISSQGETVKAYNTADEEFVAVPRHLKRWNNAQVSAIFVDSRNDIWLNYNNKKSFCRVRSQGNNLEIINKKHRFIDGVVLLRDITEDKDGNIYVATVDNVFKVNLDADATITSVESLKENSFFINNDIMLFRCLYTDLANNCIWVGTGADGLLRISTDGTVSMKDAMITQFMHDPNDKKSIASNFVSCITRTTIGDLWLGTEMGGICKILNSTGTDTEFVNFSEKDGLSNNVVKSIVSDADNNIWISTNIGLNKFDTKEKQFRIFKEDNGLPFEDFNYSREKLENGYIVMAGLNGFCYFNPESILEKENLPCLEFDNLRILNSEISPGDTINKRVVLSKRLAETKTLDLLYNENVFSLDLTSLHFSTPENHFVKHKLTPINDEWVVTPSQQRTINYNGLQPGDYELQVMASNSHNQWSSSQVLTIHIAPPFWKTWPAYCLYALLLILVFYAILFYFSRISRLKHNLEIEHLEKENAKEVNAAKLRYFSNISHEIKTPLTLISGPIELMVQRYKSNNDLSDKLRIVHRQSKKIWQLIDQVHDFQRSDANKLRMDYSQFCLNSFVDDFMFDFKFFAETEHKIFKVDNIDERIYVSADQDKLEKILNNLLNNAFKYTNTSDEIHVAFSYEDKDLVIAVSDTGRGIAPDDLPHVFERFYQSQHKHSEYTGGSGIGLAFTKRLVDIHYGTVIAQSTLGEGTTLIVKLPVVIDKPDELTSDVENEILSVEKERKDMGLIPERIDFSKINMQGLHGGSKIFIAEDNIEMRRFIEGVLNNYFTVKSFHNAKELSDALVDEWPDLIVSDVLMPVMNGFDLCKHVKSDIKTSHIPIILLTACTTIDERVEGLKEGADAYITKPFDIQHLLTCIESLLQNKQRLSERYKIDFPLTLDKEDGSENDIAFLEQLYKLIDENIDNSDLEINMLARKLYLNRTHFFQKVKAITNQTPFELLKMYRLKRAAELLVQKKLSVNEVYAMTGFKSRSNFSKLFKDKYGTTPGKYALEMMDKMN